MKKSWDVFGRKVKIRVVKGLLHPENGAPVDGIFHPDKYLIELRAEQSKDNMWRSLSHELSHAVMHRLGLWQTQMSHDHHEMICEGFANFICENFVFKK